MDYKCTIIIFNEIDCQINGLKDEHLKYLGDQVAIMVDGARFTPNFQLKIWDGKIRFFQRNGKTSVKILDEIVPYLCSWGYDISIDDKRPPGIIIKDRIDENIFNNGFVLRPYQVEAVNLLLDEGSGFLILGTGGGKTSICAALSLMCHANDLNSIIIVPSTDLVNQTIKEY